jgi:hypothetical protein
MAKPVMKEIEVFVAVNEDGDYVANIQGESEAADQLREDCGGWACRVIKVKVNVPLPTVLEATATIEEEAEATAKAS